MCVGGGGAGYVCVWVGVSVGVSVGMCQVGLMRTWLTAYDRFQGKSSKLRVNNSINQIWEILFGENNFFRNSQSFLIDSSPPDFNGTSFNYFLFLFLSFERKMINFREKNEINIFCFEGQTLTFW